MSDIRINQKIRLSDGNVGTITKLFPPCKEHSGRFIVCLHRKQYSTEQEFWYSDIGKSVFLLDDGNGE